MTLNLAADRPKTVYQKKKNEITMMTTYESVQDIKSLNDQSK